MTGASQWFDRWLGYHHEKLPHREWPPVGSEYYKGWIAAFDRHQVAPTEALDASLRLQESHPGYPEHHLEPLLAAIQAIRLERSRRNEEQARQTRVATRTADQVRLAAGRARFDALTEPDRAALLDRLAAQNPGLARLPRCLESLAVHTLAES